MNDKVTRESAVQGQGALDASRERLFNSLAPTTTKKAEEVKPAPVTTGPATFEPKMTKTVAEQKGFFRAAKNQGWGIYSVDSLDGGQKSLWYLQADENGEQYICKKSSPADEIVKRALTKK